MYLFPNKESAVNRAHKLACDQVKNGTMHSIEYNIRCLKDQIETAKKKVKARLEQGLEKTDFFVKNPLKLINDSTKKVEELRKELVGIKLPEKNEDGSYDMGSYSIYIKPSKVTVVGRKIILVRDGDLVEVEVTEKGVLIDSTETEDSEDW
jgi:hypothetical protein